MGIPPRRNGHLPVAIPDMFDDRIYQEENV
jgi:hypothetical protein